MAMITILAMTIKAMNTFLAKTKTYALSISYRCAQEFGRWISGELRLRKSAVKVPDRTTDSESVRFVAFRLIGTFSDHAKLHVAHSKDEN